LLETHGREAGAKRAAFGKPQETPPPEDYETAYDWFSVAKCERPCLTAGREFTAMLLSRRGFALASLLAASHTPALAALEQGTAAVDSVRPGQLLVAAPGMGDPRFVGTVMVMIEHGIGGALGVAINRPMADRPIAELLRAVGEDPGDAKGSLTVFLGGPVEPSVGFVVHTRDYHPSATLVLDENLAVTSPRVALRDIATGHGPRKYLFMLGYAGWGPNQLEAELSLGAWVAVSESPELVFEMDRAKVWKAAFARRTLSL
jgi:putative transcriptional regulator